MTTSGRRVTQAALARLSLILIFALAPWVARAGVFPMTAIDPVSGRPVIWSPEAGKKGAVVVFVSTRCPCSASHEPSLRALAREFRDFSFVGLVANSGEEPGAIHAHFAGAGLGFPVLRDEGGAVAKRLGALKTPHAFVFAASGERVFAGGVDDSHRADQAKRLFLKEALAALDKGERPPVGEARALGCYIE